jgi:hypothetical protein
MELTSKWVWGFVAHGMRRKSAYRFLERGKIIGNNNTAMLPGRKL